MAVLNWTNSALDDIKSIGNYLELSSPKKAKALIEQFYLAASRVKEFPRLGRKVPELGLVHIREVIIQGYRLIYLVEGNEIDILAIAHGKQDLRKKLSRR